MSSVGGRPATEGPQRLQVRRAGERFETVAPGIRTRHSFSFGRHYDPGNTAHALLVAHNDDRVRPGHGYPRHPHQDLEILTWVLSGALRHEDSQGTGGLVAPGTLQRLSAGSGIEHTEWNDAATGSEVRFVQMWVRPARAACRRRTPRPTCPPVTWCCSPPA
ncbi:pirin family protein [Nocardioides mesophilus]|uniref:pirin family protein n=1 Tax=Nocardioides mesophilus TaxID=433659 RepID=UPI001FE7017E|nr:pirin family protein [Nocardioides mesophilus]